MTTSDQGNTSTSNDPSKAGANGAGSTVITGAGGDDASKASDSIYTKERFDAVNTELNSLKQKLADAEKAKKTEIENKLGEKEDWKGLAKLREQELEETKSKLNALGSGLVTSKKMEAIKQEALKHGIRPEMLSELKNFKWDGVMAAVNDGEVEVHGAVSAVEAFKRKFEFMFQGKAPNINTATGGVNNAGTGGSKELTIKDLNVAEAEAKKSGDDSDYRAKLIAFKKQENAKQQKFQ